MSIPIAPVFGQVSDLAVKPEGVESRGQKRAQLQTEEISSSTGTAAAVTAQIERKGLAQQKRLELQDKKEKMAQDRCKNIESKIATRVNRYENNGQMLQKVYGNMKTRLERLATRLKAAGADTTKLEADLATLYGKIDKLYVNQTAFMTTLKESQTFVCGKTEGEFKTKLEEARKVPEIIKQDRTDIKTFFQTTIKADLEAIRATLGEAPEAAETPEVEGVKPVKVNKQKKNSTTTTTVEGTPTTSSSTTSTSTSTSNTTTQITQ